MSKDYTGYENDVLKILSKSSDEIQIEKNKNRKNPTVFWDYTCKLCGNNSIVATCNINSIKSCGCLRKKVINGYSNHITDEIGKKYNSLTIMSYNKEKTLDLYNRTGYTSRMYFNCLCDCGKNSTVELQALKSGHIKSCGCSKINNPLILEDLSGQKFNRLLVLYRDEERDSKNRENGKSGNVHWICQCECGNKSSVTGYQLKSGQTKSCGCLASEIVAERNRRESSKYNHHGKIKNNSVNNINDNHIEIFDENDEYSFIINKEDLDIVSRYYWRKISEKIEPNPRKRYWITNAKKEDMENGSQCSFRLHQIIAEQKYGKYDKNKLMPDHLDRNPDNNTRENIYLKNNLDNSHNRGLSRRNKSGKTGVCYNKDKKLWTANITVNYKNIYLGDYKDFDDAVKARKEAEEKYGFYSDDNKAPYDICN